MIYRIVILSVYLLLLSCESRNTSDKIFKINKLSQTQFINKGFALIYDEKLYKEKKINKKMNEKDLLIFQRNLKKNTRVIVTNIKKKKSIIAKVGLNSKYPYFYNSVITSRISDMLDLDINDPYVEIKSIDSNSLFVAKSAKTFEEEKSVANKVPVEKIKIKDLSINKKTTIEIDDINFNYSIYLADFYFKSSSDLMVSRIKNKTSIKNINITKINNTQYRVTIGSFHDLNSLKNSFNELKILNFENIEIIKN